MKGKELKLFKWVIGVIYLILLIMMIIAFSL